MFIYESNRMFVYETIRNNNNHLKSADMRTTSPARPATRTILLSCLVIACIAAFTLLQSFSPFRFRQPAAPQSAACDTVPTGDSGTVRPIAGININIDSNIEVNIQEVMKNLTLQLEVAKKALADIQVNKIHVEVEQALKNVHMNKAMQQAQVSLSKAEQAEIQIAIKNALQNVQVAKENMVLAKIQEEKIDREKIQQQVAEATKNAVLQMAKVQIDTKSIQIEIDKAQQEIRKTSGELMELKSLLDDLQKDGLVNPQQKTTLEFKKDRLFINDKEQSKKVSQKYQPYFKKHPNKLDFSGGKGQEAIDL